MKYLIYTLCILSLCLTACNNNNNNDTSPKTCENTCTTYQPYPDCSCFIAKKREATNEEKTAILQALINNDEASIQKIIDTNIDPDSKLSLVNFQNFETFKNLYTTNLKANNKFTPNTNDLTLLFLIAGLPGYDTLFKNLIDREADINHIALVANPLVMAIGQGNDNKIELLLKAGATITLEKEKEFLLETLDTRNYNASVVLAKDIKEKDETFSLPPTYIATAISSVNPTLAKAILPLSKKEDINSADAYGLTPLVKASFTWNNDLISAFIDNGADMTLPNQKGRPSLISYLYEVRLAEVEENLKEGAQAEKNLQVVKLFIEKGYPIDTQDSNGETILFYAVKDQNKPLIEFILSSKADVNIRNNMGQTALYEAARNKDGKTNLIDFLIQRGAKANIQDKDGTTPAMAAAQVGNMDAFDLLEQYAIAEN